MPRRVMRRSSFGRRSPGRLTEWGALAFGSDVVALGANTVLLHGVFSAGALAKRPFTIIRLVGSMMVQSDQNAAVENPFGAWGASIVTDEAVAVGVTAVPDPTSNPDSDLFFAYQSFAAEGSTSTNVGRPVNFQTFDFRSQRKVQDGQDIAVVVANASAADGLTFLLQFRFLMKLS